MAAEDLGSKDKLGDDRFLLQIPHEPMASVRADEIHEEEQIVKDSLSPEDQGSEEETGLSKGHERPVGER